MSSSASAPASDLYPLLVQVGQPGSAMAGDNKSPVPSSVKKRGTPGADRLDGTAGNDLLEGLGGNDSLVGFGGNDTLVGDVGADTLLGGAGEDQLNGGAGDDHLYGGAGSDAINGGAGDDTVYYTDAAARVTIDLSRGSVIGGGQTDTLINIESVFGSHFDDVIRGSNRGEWLTGGNGNDSIYGNGGSDRIAGGAGHDEIWGSDEADVLMGGADNDTLYAGYGDTVDGGAGNDQIESVFGAAALIDGGAGSDRLVNLLDGSFSVTANAVGTFDIAIKDVPTNQITTTTVRNVEVVNILGLSNPAGQGDFDLVAKGDVAKTTSQLVAGTVGSEALFGGRAADQLFGGRGDDTMTGGLGNDTLSGGEGSDQFRYGFGSGQRVWDGSDQISGGGGFDWLALSRSLKDVGFSVVVGGQTIAAVGSGTSATGVDVNGSGQILFKNSTTAISFSEIERVNWDFL